MSASERARSGWRRMSPGLGRRPAWEGRSRRWPGSGRGARRGSRWRDARPAKRRLPPRHRRSRGRPAPQTAVSRTARAIAKHPSTNPGTDGESGPSCGITRRPLADSSPCSRMNSSEAPRGAMPLPWKARRSPFPAAPDAIRAGDDGEEIAPDATATGHDDRRDERGRDRRVDRVAARGQHTQPGRRDEGMLRADDAVSRHDGADPAPVAACRFRLRQAGPGTRGSLIASITRVSLVGDHSRTSKSRWVRG